ncbi:hypothetical protein Holit_01380 [Hollandina sp. SP2]
MSHAEKSLLGDRAARPLSVVGRLASCESAPTGAGQTIMIASGEVISSQNWLNPYNTSITGVFHGIDTDGDKSTAEKNYS